eukprot:TRINITY_DN2216_c0_g2_i4.p1 TRINITY_DN2216_c0_g2~~TRINITY_DN2216_c0_g2_i4.p1  ORF type:complete len:801 (+),score=204.81 TRINITY_DN2216_c0_g2_i4:69-2471(+)
MAGHSKSAMPAATCLLAAGAVCTRQMSAFTAAPRAASSPQVQQSTGAYSSQATPPCSSASVAAGVASGSALAAAASVVGSKTAARKLRKSERKAARQAVVMQAGHALIMQNKGGGHGEIGYHLALALQKKGLKVTILQDSAAKKNKVPYSLYDSDLPEAGITWMDPEDTQAYSAAAMAALQNGPPVTHIFDNYSKKPEQIEPLLAVAKASPDFKLYSFISSAGMYTAKGELTESLAVKDPPTGQRLVEMKLSQELPGKWASFRPQYIYGPYTNKRGYLDWFLARAARGLPMPVPGDASQPVNVAHCEDVAALLSGVVGRETAAGGEVFNCGTVAQVTYQQLCEAAGKAVGKPAKVVSLPAGTKTSFPFRPNAEGFYVNVDKARDILGFTAKYNVLTDMAASGFYTQDFNSLGLAQGDLDTSKDLPEGMEMPAATAGDGPFGEGQRVVIMGPQVVAGKEGTIVMPDCAYRFVKLDSGSVVHLSTDALLDAATGSRFRVGQRVQVRAPKVLTGKIGTVLGGPVSKDTVHVRFDGDSMKYLVAAKDLVEGFDDGQRVQVLAPAVLKGRVGTVVGAPVTRDTVNVRLDGEVNKYLLATKDLISDASAPVPAAAAATASNSTTPPATAPVTPAPTAAAPVTPAPTMAASTSSGSTEEEELEFTPGQKVTLLGPPAMAGKAGTIVGPALGDAFAVRFDSGSIFNIATSMIQDAAGAATPPPPPPVASTPVATPVASMSSSAGSTEEEELEFTPGQKVTFLGPPAMAGKSGTVVGPALSDSFAVRLESGSIFNISTENLKALEPSMA